jgi:hypothetical protein
VDLAFGFEYIERNRGRQVHTLRSSPISLLYLCLSKINHDSSQDVIIIRAVEEEIVKTHLAQQTSLVSLSILSAFFLAPFLCEARGSYDLPSWYHTVPISVRPKSHVLVAGCQEGKVVAWRSGGALYTP